MSVILGINAFHADSASSVVVDGSLLAAAEEERFRRIKHWAGFPSESIKFCLDEAGLKISDIDYLAINSDPTKNLSKKISFSVLQNPGLSTLVNKIKSINQKNLFSDDFIRDLIKKNLGEDLLGDIKKVEHHKAHLVSAHTASGFEESLSVSIDGLGDFVSTSWGLGYGKKVDIKEKIFFPHSLGIFYEALTHFLGFKNYGDEYKVMGLAPYGSDTYLSEVRKLIRLKSNAKFELDLDYFSHHKGGGQHTWEGGIPKSEDCFGQMMSDLLGPAREPNDELTKRHMDIAYAVQKVYEESFFHIINELHRKFKIDNLSLSGGCGNNSVANGKIYRNSPFKNAYVASSSGDAGGAIGAALEVALELNEIKDKFCMKDAYYGPSFKDSYHENLISGCDELSNEDFKVDYVSSEDDLCRKTSEAISNGLVIGWFQGKMEWGPRALGNRSILGDPRREDMKDILNLKIKRRESFRPFAPSILRESVSEWFEEDDDVPFMMKVFQIKEDKSKLIPAVTHVDGSGRLQTVSTETNRRYANLIKSFNDLTGVPILLNTSFNENEPIVCSPEEALNCFLRTKMDLLVLGNWMIKRIQV
ncbi:MAG: carbamoyltransferase [Candidatus Marinimicrobia bacterium]|nr:carbamoyltransferase [Candidatus Neomarinimicrobiota bacterium]